MALRIRNKKLERLAPGCDSFAANQSVGCSVVIEVSENRFVIAKRIQRPGQHREREISIIPKNGGGVSAGGCAGQDDVQIAIAVEIGESRARTLFHCVEAICEGERSVAIVFV